MTTTHNISNESPSERIKRIVDTVEAIASEVERTHPHAEIIRGKYVTDLVYYSVSVVNGKIVTEKQTRTINIKCEAEKITRGRYLSKSIAEEAIKKVLPEAQKHFENILKAYRELSSSMKFSIGHNYDGDTHGIYNEYDYVSFELNGFHFQFPIDE